jgi:hypothetical protein
MGAEVKSSWPLLNTLALPEQTQMPVIILSFYLPDTAV